MHMHTATWEGIPDGQGHTTVSTYSFTLAWRGPFPYIWTAQEPSALYSACHAAPNGASAHTYVCLHVCVICVRVAVTACAGNVKLPPLAHHQMHTALFAAPVQACAHRFHAAVCTRACHAPVWHAASCRMARQNSPRNITAAHMWCSRSPACCAKPASILWMTCTAGSTQMCWHAGAAHCLTVFGSAVGQQIQHMRSASIGAQAMDKLHSTTKEQHTHTYCGLPAAKDQLPLSRQTP